METISMAAGKTASNINIDNLGKEELLRLWLETDKELRETSPFTDFKEWAELRMRFDAIVQAYYKDSDGVLRLEQEN